MRKGDVVVMIHKAWEPYVSEGCIGICKGGAAYEWEKCNSMPMARVLGLSQGLEFNESMAFDGDVELLFNIYE